MRFAYLLFFMLVLNGCAHYRSRIGEFRGPSSYGRPNETAQPTYPQDLYNRSQSLSKVYAPKSPFRLFWPVKKVRVTQNFKRYPLHEGIDLGGGKGLPILAAHEGIVVYTGHDFSGYGKMVLLEYNRHWATLYGHLNDISVSEGMVVKPGDRIGSMGNTGRSTGVHLHFELMQNRQPIDPLTVLPSTRGLY